jgi:biotin transporter BioY
MKDEYGQERSQNKREFYYYIPSSWVAQFARTLTKEITRVVTVAVTLVTTILILIVGGWLLYTYLPATTFNIIIAVILADILLGIMVRFIMHRRKHRRLSGQ